MAQLFGFSIDDSYKKPSPSVVSPVPKNNEDGADYYLASGFYGQYLDVEGVFKTEYDLIRSCLLYTSPSPRDLSTSRMPSSA